MLVLTDTQKQDVLRYVDDKTYTHRCCFVLGLVYTVLLTSTVVSEFKNSDGFLDVSVTLTNVLVSVCIVLHSLREVLRFRHVRDYFRDGVYAATRKQVVSNVEDVTTQTTDYSGGSKSSLSYYGGDDYPRSHTVTIKKYYVVDRYGVKYECIRYLDYRKCIECGECIAVEFPTGERFALYERSLLQH